MTKLEILTKIVRMGGDRKSYYLLLPKNVVEMFDMVEGEGEMRIEDGVNNTLVITLIPRGHR